MNFHPKTWKEKILITHELLLHTKPQIVRQNISKVFIVLGMHNFVYSIKQQSSVPSQYSGEFTFHE